MNERLSIVAITLTLAGCAAAPPAAPTMAIPAIAPLPTPPSDCEAIKKSFYPLNRLSSQAASARIGAIEPTDPRLLETELSAVVTAARAASPRDAEMSKLVEDVDTRFTTMAARVHDFAEARSSARAEDARSAIEALLHAAEDSSAFVAAGHRRCDPSSGVTEVSGRLPPEVIQKIVRSHFGEYRGCYEDGLRRNAKLEGRVLIHFVIGRDGHIGNITEAEPGTVPKDAFGFRDPTIVEKPSVNLPRMPDPKVIACVLAAFRPLVFPEPERGIVTVTYPLMFAPGG
jgi:hypothetical protein